FLEHLREPREVDLRHVPTLSVPATARSKDLSRTTTADSGRARRSLGDVEPQRALPGPGVKQRPHVGGPGRVLRLVNQLTDRGGRRGHRLLVELLHDRGPAEPQAPAALPQRIGRSAATRPARATRSSAPATPARRSRTPSHDVPEL